MEFKMNTTKSFIIVLLLSGATTVAAKDGYEGRETRENYSSQHAIVATSSGSRAAAAYSCIGDKEGDDVAVYSRSPKVQKGIPLKNNGGTSVSSARVSGNRNSNATRSVKSAAIASASNSNDNLDTGLDTSQKSSKKIRRETGVSAIAIAGGASTAAAVSSGNGSAVVSVGTGPSDSSGAVAASGRGKFVGVTSAAGSEPKIYTSREEMVRDMEADESNRAMEFLRKFMRIFDW